MAERIACWRCGEMVSTFQTVCPRCGQAPKRSAKAAAYPLKIVGVFSALAAVVVLVYTLLVG